MVTKGIKHQNCSGAFLFVQPKLYKHLYKQ
uniref:Uncharacterized protein n=1 Tax=Myoviridae sp. ctZhr26 TaxID=2827694 RepID=A0A8S5T798_9CAUD|nr:MAG TPA: hypothetical protein [Myoviridae sp. ctZhr26]DAG73526.1 MAG TPA: hypothetical protein [Caudoviricetes sp.]